MNIRTAVAVCATLALVGCFANASQEYVKISADAVVAEADDGIGLTPKEKEEVLKEGDKAKAPCHDAQVPGCTDEVVAPNIPLTSPAPPEAAHFPEPKGAIEKNCMEAKIYSYTVADELTELEDNALGPVTEILQCLTPEPMTKENVVPSACAEQFQKCTQGIDGVLDLKIDHALSDAMGGTGILKKVTTKKGHQVVLDWGKLGLDVGADDSMKASTLGIAASKFGYQDVQKAIGKAFGAGGLHSSLQSDHHMSDEDVKILEAWPGD